MALNTLDSLMITVTVVALVALISLAIYTWIKWRRKQLQRRRASEFMHVTAEPSDPHTHHVVLLNGVPNDSPSGSRTLLSEDMVVKIKPHPPAESRAYPAFHTDDIVFHALAERDPDKLEAGDTVYHADGSFKSETATSPV